MAAHFDETFGVFDSQFRERDVLAGRLVEGRGGDLGRDRAGEVGDFGAFADQHQHQLAFGMVFGDAVGNGLQDRGFPDC
jgi:hypothetical protein